MPWMVRLKGKWCACVCVPISWVHPGCGRWGCCEEGTQHLKKAGASLALRATFSKLLEGESFNSLMWWLWGFWGLLESGRTWASSWYNELDTASIEATQNHHLLEKRELNLWAYIKEKPSQLNLLNAAFLSCFLNLLHSVFSPFNSPTFHNTIFYSLKLNLGSLSWC